MSPWNLPPFFVSLEAATFYHEVVSKRKFVAERSYMLDALPTKAWCGASQLFTHYHLHTLNAISRVLFLYLTEHMLYISHALPKVILTLHSLECIRLWLVILYVYDYSSSVNHKDRQLMCDSSWVLTKFCLIL
ncbi:hypothetical protein PRUPE_6G136600 [Prunus persica]|uniref:Uncharacterized protein n=1 Tax=Prunus persica TaxID=3760 RepID=A0A251NPZ6_PRUPE|nr:hypothetical protein PRUPE_6G136600 [Prunus persica]